MADLPDGAFPNDAAAALATNWSRFNPMAAAGRIHGLPEGEMLDAMLADLAVKDSFGSRKNDDTVPRRQCWLMIAPPAENNPEDDASECELLRRFAADRDPGAFADLVGRHYGMVCGIGRRVLGDPHEAEDIAQAVFVLLAEKAPVLARRDPVRVGRWLVGASFRLAQNRRRVLGRRRRREREYAERQPDVGEGDRAESALAVIDEAIAELPRPLRDAVIARHLRGLSYNAAAVELKITPTTFRGRLARAKELLTKRLADRGFAVSGTALVALLTSLRDAGAAAPVGFAAGAMAMAKPAAVGGIIGVAIWKWAAALILLFGIGIAVRTPPDVVAVGFVGGSNPHGLRLPSADETGGGETAAAARAARWRGLIAARLDGQLAYTPREIAPEDNGFGLVLDLDKAFDHFSDGLAYDSLKSLSRMAAGDEQWDAEMAAAALAAGEPFLSIYDEILAVSDLRFPLHLHFTSSSYLANVQRGTLALAKLRTEDRFRAGDVTGAINFTLGELDFGNRLSTGEGDSVHFVVALTVKGQAHFRLSRYLDAAGRSLTDGDLALIDQSLEASELGVETIATTLQVDYVSALRSVERALAGEMPANHTARMLTGAANGGRGFPDLSGEDLGAFLDRLDLERLVLLIDGRFLEAHHILREPVAAREISLESVRQSLPHHLRLEDLAPEQAADLAACSLFEFSPTAVIDHSLAGIALHRLLRTRVAVQRAHSAGSTPTSLDALVPDYLDAVPADPFDGRPLRFDSERGVLYSIGIDRIDNGGVVRDPGWQASLYEPVITLPGEVILHRSNQWESALGKLPRHQAEGR